MAIPTNKAELIHAIQSNYEKLMVEFRSIPEELTSSQTLTGHAKGTVISPHDLVSYLVGWGQLVLKWNRIQECGEQVNFPETGYKWNELGRLAQKFYLDYQDDNFTTLLNRLGCTVIDILSVINSKSNEEIYGIVWYEKWTLGRMIQFNTSSPFGNARARIRRWKKDSHIV